MKFTTVCAFISALAAQQVVADIDDYFALSAEEKQKELWTAVLEDTMPGKWYSAVVDAQLLTEDLNPTMEYPGDEMPIEKRGKERKKLIHTVGDTAKFRLTSSGDHPFTGAFSKGTETGMIRISMAAQPNQNKQFLIPGMGLKFLRDGIDSASMVAMYSVDGQDSFNIFKNDWANHIKDTTNPALKILSKTFAKVSDYPNGVGVSDIASFENDGTAVESVVFPFLMRFEPTDEVRNMFPDTYTSPYTEQLMTIKEGTLLFNVYGWDAPEEMGGVEHSIGELYTTSMFTTTTFGDETLFFRHQSIESDLVLMPEWQPYEPKYHGIFAEDMEISPEMKASCPFAHLWQ